MANQAFVAWVQLETPPADPTPERSYVAWAQLELPAAVDFTVALTGAAAGGSAGALVPGSLDVTGLPLTQQAATGAAGVLVPSSVPTGGLPVGDEPWWMTRGGARKRRRDEDEEVTAVPTAVPTAVAAKVTATAVIAAATVLPQAAGLLAEPPPARKRYAPLRPIRSKQSRDNASPLSTDEDDEEVLLLLV